MNEDAKNNNSKSNQNETDNQSEDFVIEEEGEDEKDSFGNSKDDRRQKLKQKLAKCKEERKEYLAGWQRAKADLANKKKEFAEEKEKIRTLANEKLVEDIIPVLDSFQMAFADTQKWEQVSAEWRTGVENIHTQLMQALRANGLSVIEPEAGDEFDPRKHEAAETTRADKSDKDGTIQSTNKRGYTLNDRIIRPAQVVVAQYNESDH